MICGWNFRQSSIYLSASRWENWGFIQTFSLGSGFSIQVQALIRFPSLFMVFLYQSRASLEYTLIVPHSSLACHHIFLTSMILRSRSSASSLSASFWTSSIMFSCRDDHVGWSMGACLKLVQYTPSSMGLHGTCRGAGALPQLVALAYVGLFCFWRCWRFWLSCWRRSGFLGILDLRSSGLSVDLGIL